jgi:hypothetical protein
LLTISLPASEQQKRASSKSNDQIRSQFMAQLQNKKVWLKPQEKPLSHQTCIIFDWDDTILCTSFLAPHQELIYNSQIKFPTSLQIKLGELDKVACEIL